jgi:CheY-like chemotaxis protein
VSAERDPAFAIVRIADSGIGIAEAELAEIFTMFSQAASARAVDHLGLGIGLALAKQLTEMHGGLLTAASEGPGKGSVFTLRLPLEASATDEEPPQPSQAPQPPPGVMPKRVLLVDDNVDAVNTLAELLALDGHETHVAHDGPSAIEAAYRLRPDAAVVDIGLPGFSGLEVAKRLREDPIFSGLYLVALSGWVQPEDLTRSAEAGFDHHLAKPVAVQALEQLLAQSGEATPPTS